MLECRIINGHPWSIGCGDPNPSKRGEDAALMSDLPVEIQHKVSDWIFGKLWKRNTPNYDHDSYELKHRIENEYHEKQISYWNNNLGLYAPFSNHAVCCRM